MKKLIFLVVDNPLTSTLAVGEAILLFVAKLPQCAEYRDALLELGASIGTLFLFVRDPPGTNDRRLP